MERLEIIETLKHAPDAFAAAIAGVPEDVRRRRPGDGQWSINEVIGHVRDMMGVWHTRLYMVATQTDPMFVGFDGDASIAEHNYQEANLNQLIEAMRAQRSETIELLEHTVDWSRIGQHGDMGRRSFKQWAEFVIDHDNDHLQQIATLKAG